MEKIKCIIVEDQIPAQRILQGYISEVPELELVGTFISPLEALPILKEHSIGVLFLDIHLPKISGIELIKLLKDPPPVVLTTAFTEYAVESFELDVLDYLLKPYSFERFLKSISKIQEIYKNDKPIVHRKSLFVRTKHVIQKININEIHHIESRGDFLLLYTLNERHIANTSLQDILPRIGNGFVRCHKSYIININCIQKIHGNTISVGEHDIPIGRTYKEEVLKRLEMI